MNFPRRTLPIVLAALVLVLSACAGSGPAATLRHSEFLNAQAQFNSAMNAYTSAHTSAQNLLSEMGADQTKGQAAYGALAASDRTLSSALRAIKAPTDVSDPGTVSADLTSAIGTTDAAATLEAQFATTPMSGWATLSAQSATILSAQSAALYNLGIDLNSANASPSSDTSSAASTLGGTLKGLAYQNLRWGISASLPTGWTYGPVLVVAYTAIGTSGEQVDGTMSVKQPSTGQDIVSHSDFGTLLIPNLSADLFATDMVKPAAGTTWSAVSNLTIDGKAAWRADAASSDGLSHITVIGFAGSGQVLILSTPDPSAIAAWISSIHIKA